VDHVTTTNISDPVETFTDWEWFQNLPSDLVSPRIQINLRGEGDKLEHDFITLVHRLVTSKVKP